MKRLQLGIKRLIDIVGSALGLVLLSPIMALTALLIRMTMGKPVVFRQTRPGKNEKLFTIYKFRTMTDAQGLDGKLLPDGERLTGFGRFLRRWSLDELPQLWNVLKGDMSLVGPRPLLLGYLDRYTPEQRRRHEMRPGVTGLAQVKGRQSLVFSRRLELDVWYVDHWSLLLDLRVIMLTVIITCFGTGVRHGQDVREVDDLPERSPESPKKESVAAQKGDR